MRPQAWGHTSERRRVAPRREQALQAAALRDATPPRAVHVGAGRHGAAALGPLRGQRSGRFGQPRRKRGRPVRALAVIRTAAAGVVWLLGPLGSLDAEAALPAAVA